MAGRNLTLALTLTLTLALALTLTLTLTLEQAGRRYGPRLGAGLQRGHAA